MRSGWDGWLVMVGVGDIIMVGVGDCWDGWWVMVGLADMGVEAPPSAWALFCLIHIQR